MPHTEEGRERIISLEHKVSHHAEMLREIRDSMKETASAVTEIRNVLAVNQVVSQQLNEAVREIASIKEDIQKMKISFARWAGVGGVLVWMISNMGKVSAVLSAMSNY
ncbi:hypothetical protein vBYenM636_44 [Yersinia phage vB_YenM_636]|nr:hypothetical protein vBYenM12_44 [Yersinia phage vB_YenM_12]QKN86386.1 hypothetical protein vBYenM22_44 [Yersinia phage vB_YenM_22]QKN86477.1 hypothetical protein vBYenM25_44 [Yersinia phage vB_YenM_25]QKN86568.1 hypothetical protein vBYenM27_44 [Yersinia phage vB_YenM_27]QKN86659.1 hypothetical protein vBYenM39_44 [Yersinia phage vB_YenM_39]QKN86750.1 hypothetical protein vBYenM126_44 [Yersinia phage vB_YenM_126]QKN86841.1 hypothetical protein vBYenM526-1_44 [Yersinia phage vB_YenM_526-1]